MFRPDVRKEIDLELSKAAQARQAGFEGRARVCARRAAGAAVREFLLSRGVPLPGQSAYDLLIYLQEAPDIPAHLRQAARRLTTQVSGDFSLPIEADLIEEARQLAQELEARLPADE